MTMRIQFGLNEPLNRKLNPDNYLCDPFTEDCSAVAQATRAAEAEEAKNSKGDEEEEEEIDLNDDEFWVSTFDF